MSKITSENTRNLLVDPKIPETNEQNFACVSFVAPKDMIEQKKLYSINKFMSSDINNELAMVGKQLGMYVSRELKNKFDEEFEKIAKIEDPETANAYKKILDSIYKRININEDELEKKCLREYSHEPDDLIARYENYIVDHGMEIEREFEQMNNGQTSTLGFKVRSVSDTRQECEHLAKYFAEDVENYVDTYVAPTGVWIPFNPDPQQVTNQKHQIKELDDLLRSSRTEKAYQDKQFRKRIFDDTTQQDSASGTPIDYSTSTGSKLHQLMEQKEREKEAKKFGLNSELVTIAKPSDVPEKKRRRRHRKPKSESE
jgi:hypothetical protein